ncbi:MAG: DUF333 domain-containing protein [Candidatus Altiarchaeota archaeon]
MRLMAVLMASALVMGCMSQPEPETTTTSVAETTTLHYIPMGQVENRIAAEAYVKNMSSFLSDCGGLKLASSTDAGCPSCWVFRMTFDCGRKSHSVLLRIDNGVVKTASEAVSERCIFEGDCVTEDQPVGVRKSCVDGVCIVSQFEGIASSFCIEKGFHLKQKRQPTGATFNICVFPDGGMCEEEAYFSGRCDQASGNLTNCQGYVSREPCVIDYNPVCAFIEHTPQASNKTDWRTFTNPCIACTTFTKSTSTLGFMVGECSTTTTTLQSSVYDAAARFCEENGHAYRVKKRLSGREYGVCVFGPEDECDADDYFDGLCKPKKT